MSAQHTPGPCLVERGRGIKGYPFAICAPYHDGLPGTAVLAVVAYKPHADLYAAAPQLLEVAKLGLEFIEKDLEGTLESHCKLDADLNPIRDTLDIDLQPQVATMEVVIAAGKATIAKAEGRS